MPCSLIIDTDPGHDDAFAILLALASSNVTVLGLTAVAGNIPARMAAENARRIVELAGRAEVEVRTGADLPLFRPARHAHDIHGKTGIDGYDWADPEVPPCGGYGPEWIISTIRQHPPGTITLLALGPLTNIAQAFRRAPDIVARLAGMVMMGGGFFEGGNVTPSAEFNIVVDPEAASIVFRSGVRLTVLPIDCSNRALMPGGWADCCAALGTRTGDACAGMIRFFERHGNAKYGTRTRPLHDVLAMAWILWPELFSGRACHVGIETSSPLTLGMTVVDWWHVLGKAPNCLWLRDCDHETIYARILECLSRLP
ncbi:nucleoside hydrolase [Komagataeibacter xylinus]|uniref:Nucleoside hydrolase n=1 Tax=Komagataeibacter rhaeticus TaxID=215221 RepID=A0A181CAQ0_9PROT|nr:nucleoside hydrolase [Komagataeibacter xylinus]QIP35428.1 nucleoside hydrolase [Komagataeibacter rhaeticus]QOC47997.1 nucleoside hydrolase [Komagataeibacter rhaeticus]SAY48659.1 Pyrimidine-specific ribonucleoside hydrolase RihA [Komagataeibacter rhaeticus]